METRQSNQTRRGSIRLLLTLASLTLLSASGFDLLAQSTTKAASEMRFKVVSIKPNTQTFEEYSQASGGSFGIGFRTMPGGRFIASYSTLRPIIAQAFELTRPQQLEGGPPWLDSDKFDIDARASRDVSAQELNAMLRTMLAERFQLQTHVVTREVPLYAVTLQTPNRTNTWNLRPTSAECVAMLAKREEDGAPRGGIDPPDQNPETSPVCGVNWNGRGRLGGKRLSFGGTTMTYLLRSLAAEFDAPLDDRTGLSGSFDVTLEFESTARQRSGRAGVGEPSGAPALRDALQNQLGLKVEKMVGPLSFTVIDSIARPTPN